MKRVVIVGAGAAGLAAAVTAAQLGAQVTLLEAADRVGKSILRTGNGRCNLTNMEITPYDYSEPLYVAELLNEYTAEDIRDFFERLGLITVEENEGRVYPFSGVAHSVLDVLRFACARYGVKTVCNAKVVSIAGQAGAFSVVCEDGSAFAADAVIVATGGGSDVLSRLGHRVKASQHVLCSLATTTDAIRGLSGVRVQAKVSAYEDGDDELYAWGFGEVLFRDYGLSGIVVFDMSREVEEGDWLSLDLAAQISHEDLKEWIEERLASMQAVAQAHNAKAPSYEELMAGMLHPRLNAAVLKAAGFRPSRPAKMQAVSYIVDTMKDLRVQVLGVGDAKHAQVTRGGLDTDEFNAKTLESKLVPGIFAAGEAMDVDGRCGGFNLHWAWASGMAAAKAAAS